jgi:hypothetical protein
MEILRSQIAKQVKMSTVFTSKSFNTVCDSVIGKHVVVIKFNNFTASGVGNSELEAIENAKYKISLL